MAKEKLWTMGNRVPSEFVTELEMARRKAEQHRKATPEAWQDYVALRKLVEQAVSKLLVLEDERADFTRRLTIDPPPADMNPEDADALCQDAVGGTLGHISHDAFMKGWRNGEVYRAMIAYGEYMLAFEKKSMGVNPFGENHRAAREQREDEQDQIELRFGTSHRMMGTRSR